MIQTRQELGEEEWRKDNIHLCIVHFSTAFLPNMFENKFYFEKERECSVHVLFHQGFDRYRIHILTILVVVSSTCTSGLTCTEGEDTITHLHVNQ